ncbi:MAG: glycoside hydrolase family 6 protein [Janthinobacterium lividum]
MDARTVFSDQVSSTAWTTVETRGAWSAGNHTVTVTFTNDIQAPGCDRNLRLDTVSFTASTPPTPTPAPTPGNPLAGTSLWSDPTSNARQEMARRAGDPAAVADLRKIADQPGTEWIGDWVATGNVAQRVRGVVAAATSSGTVPVLALYAIPHRDCGSYSAGGLADAGSYAAWIRQVRDGLGSGRAVIVLEPDALAQLDCLPSDADRQSRTAILRDAVSVLASAPGAVTYLDAGTSRWIGADEMAHRLRDAGVASTRGFALNVSNFGTTAAEDAFGDQLSSRLGGKTYVVDTSRNGNGPGDTWCNPQGRALGARPTTATGHPGADAYLWIKRVGESDGDCGRGEPSAGTWWADYAIGLAQRAPW